MKCEAMCGNAYHDMMLLQCRGQGAKPAVGQTTSFPYSIVEVKLQTQTAPSWLQALISSGELPSQAASAGAEQIV